MILSCMVAILKEKKEIIYLLKEEDLLRKMERGRLMKSEMAIKGIIEVLEKDINLNILI